MVRFEQAFDALSVADPNVQPMRLTWAYQRKPGDCPVDNLRTTISPVCFGNKRKTGLDLAQRLRLFERS